MWPFETTAGILLRLSSQPLRHVRYKRELRITLPITIVQVDVFLKL